MNRRTYGLLAGLAGTALGAWWWRRRGTPSTQQPARERGTVIFDNTPVAIDDAVF